MTVLETDRLILRHLAPDDLDAIHAVLGDPVALELWPRTFTRDESAAWIQRWLKSYEKHGHGLWAVVLKDTSVCIGDCGITLQEVDGRTELEIGYHLQFKHWGHGYATEAAAACRDYGFDVLRKPKLISLIMPQNLRSRRVAERIGMRVEKETLRKSIPHLVYAISVPSPSPST